MVINSPEVCHSWNYQTGKKTTKVKSSYPSYSTKRSRYQIQRQKGQVINSNEITKNGKSQEVNSK